MHRHTASALSLTLVLAIVLTAVGTAASEAGQPAAPEAPLTGAPTVVSYQGQVTVGGAPYTGDGYFKLAVVDQVGATSFWSNDGASTGGGQPTNAVKLSVNNGLFNVLLGDTALPNMTALPASAFAGTERYLRVWFSSDNISFTQLAPDRRIAAVPYALQAEEAKNAWSLSGNTGTMPGTHFLGTTDNQALQLHVNGLRALRLEPNATSPNVIAGYSGNSVTTGAPGATVGGGGGGGSGNANRVTDSYGVVGGGFGNIAGDNTGSPNDQPYATVGGGLYNTARNTDATVSGGARNTASGSNATVSGGSNNTASGYYATVSGGYSNTASGNYATVSGGSNNTASGNYSHAAGFRAIATNLGSFVWADATSADFNSTADNQFAVRATGGVRLETGAAAVRVNGNTVWHAGNDASGSGLDADLLDGQHGAYYQDAGSLNAGTLATDRYSAYGDLGAEGYLGDAAGDLARNNAALQATLNADLVDGKHALEAGDPLRRASPPQANTATAVDTGGDVGEYGTSISIGADGLPVVSYRDGTNADLKVLHCGNATCTSGNTVTAVDTAGNFGQDSALTIGADGLPVVSYSDGSNADLKVLHCGDSACTSGNTMTSVDTAGGVGLFNSITIGADSLPVMSYLDVTNWDLKVLHCGDAACTAGNTATAVDTAGAVGWATSIATGADGLPVVSYVDYTNYDLKVLHCGDAACTAGNTATAVDTAGNVGQYNSITIGADGLPVVSYFDYTNFDLKVLHCGNAACTAGNTVTAVDPAVAANQTSITIGVDGLPVVSYSGGGLKVLRCGNAACTAGNTATTVDTGGNVGSYTSLTIGADSLPVVSYYDATNDDLKVLHCSNAFCTPYFRRR